MGHNQVVLEFGRLGSLALAAPARLAMGTVEVVKIVNLRIEMLKSLGHDPRPRLPVAGGCAPSHLHEQESKNKGQRTRNKDQEERVLAQRKPLKMSQLSGKTQKR